MKKIVLTAAAALLVAGCANTQNQGYQQGYYVPADAQAAGVTAVDAQIEAVRANYEDVKAQAQAQIDARKKAEAAAAMSNATAERAKDFVDNQVEEGRAKIDQIKAQSEAIRAGTAK